MAKLTTGFRRESKYAQGGVSQIISFNTFLENGLKAFTVTRDSDGKITGITMVGDNKPYVMESEIDQAAYSDATQIGTNRYCKHSLSLKLAGRTDALTSIAIAFDLSHTTHIVRTRQGQIVLLGEGNGLSSEKNDSGSGLAAGDFNGYDFTLSGAENAKAPIVPESVFNTLLTAAAAAPGSTTPEPETGG